MIRASKTQRAPRGGDFAVRGARSDWVRLRTLILLRWLAIGGQAAAILAASGIYGIRLDLGLCFAVVSASVIVNLFAAFVYPENKRLSEAEATATFVFDTVQLAALLSLTGGLSNPFALLILGPVTIAATTLRKRSTVVVGLLTILQITTVAFFRLPLLTAAGDVIAVPGLIEFGVWVAIVIGVVFLGLYAQRVSSEIHSMGDALLATQMALAREQKLTDLGGVVAAAAHELGTPLATIKLASAELAEALRGNPGLQEDAILIRQQADRCRDILRSMGRAGKDDLYLRSAPLSAVIQEAAEPHTGRGKLLHLGIRGAGATKTGQPVIERKPEVIHGLRNLIQNAVDFARGNVWIETEWSEGRILLRITDDGDGYPSDLIGRIGDPFVRRRRSAETGLPRPEYDGMGLGLFIAKTLLERTGAELSFANGSDPVRSGAVVEVIWPEDRLLASDLPVIGQNPAIQNIM